MISASLVLLALVSLAPGQHHGVMYHSPQWSPDGRWILVSATLDGDAELYLVSTRGEPMRKLTDNSASDDLARWIDGGRQWSADGKQIAFMRDDPTGVHIWVMAADGTAQRCLTCSPSR